MLLRENRIFAQKYFRQETFSPDLGVLGPARSRGRTPPLDPCFSRFTGFRDVHVAQVFGENLGFGDFFHKEHK